MKKCGNFGLERHKPTFARRENNIMSNGKTVKDMLKEGANADALIEGLKKEIAAAQKELDRENTKASSLDLARFDFLKAVSKYGEELGIIEKGSVDEDMMRAAAQTLEELEPDIKKYAKILDILFSDDEEEEEMEDTSKTWIPTSLTKYGVNVAPVDLDSKLSDLIKGLMKD